MISEPGVSMEDAPGRNSRSGSSALECGSLELWAIDVHDNIILFGAGDPAAAR